MRRRMIRYRRSIGKKPSNKLAPVVSSRKNDSQLLREVDFGESFDSYTAHLWHFQWDFALRITGRWTPTKTRYDFRRQGNRPCHRSTRRINMRNANSFTKLLDPKLKTSHNRPTGDKSSSNRR